MLSSIVWSTEADAPLLAYTVRFVLNNFTEISKHFSPPHPPFVGGKTLEQARQKKKMRKQQSQEYFV